MGKDTIYVQTQTKENYKRDKKLTAKQWKIYYYLLSVSKYNSQKREDHRYVYKKDFNISACCRMLGIKSNQTFYNAIAALSKHGLVYDDGAHFLLYYNNWIDINKDVLSNLIDYSNGEDREQYIDLLRLYLIFKKLDSIAENAEERQVTKRQLILLLGHSDTTTENYKTIETYLALLSFWGLIELKTHTAYNSNTGSYTVYHLQKVNEFPNNASFESDIQAEMQSPLPSEELMAKLRFSFPELLNASA